MNILIAKIQQILTRRLGGILSLLMFFILLTLPFTASSFTQNINALMELYSQEGQHNRIESPFNGVMLVAKDNKILLKKAYGFYDKENNIPLVEDAKFLIGSVTKQFTAMLVMQQVERGNIDLEMTVSDYLPYFPKENGAKITIHRLLSHTSGLPHYEGLRRLGIKSSEFRKMSVTPNSYVKLIAQMELINEPGTEFYYSSQNYILLGAILEQVTGKSFAQLLDIYITKPLALKNTGYADNKYHQQHIAKGYQFKQIGFFSELFSSEKGEYKLAKYRDLSNAYTTGGMYSTVDDLYTWSKALKSHKLLSKPLTDKMFSPNIGGYGYGWYINHETMIRFNPSIQLISHGGSLDGYSSNLAMYGDGTTVIYLANVTPVGNIRLTMNMHLAANNVAIDEFKRDIKLPNVNGDLDDFHADGGLAGLKAYYQEISRRAGYKVNMNQWGYQEFIKLHLSENKLAIAEQFYQEMLCLYTTPNKGWLNKIGYDFLEYQAYQQAIDSFELNVKNHQYSASAYDSLGDAYRESGQLNLAKNSFSEAVSLAKSNNDSNLSYYEKQLSGVLRLRQK
ncbi:MAG: serine hydrolase [Colwellia sp.]|nr:serine hydrolase [Colwellia sp.]